MPDNDATRAKRYRDRKAGLLPDLPDCPKCGKQVRNADKGGLCSRCWRLTPEGREWNAAKTARSRSRAEGKKKA